MSKLELKHYYIDLFEKKLNQALLEGNQADIDYYRWQIEKEKEVLK